MRNMHNLSVVLVDAKQRQSRETSSLSVVVNSVAFTMTKTQKTQKRRLCLSFHNGLLEPLHR